jgi:hypothetical protein
MDDLHTPTLSQAFADRDPTQLSTCSTKPNENFRRSKPSAKIRDLIARLGLRYRPTNQADLEAHAGMLALLAEDLADVPTDLLERAVQHHVATSPYMPKAADLIRLAQSFQKPPTTLEAYAEQLNEMNFSQALGYHWFVREHPDGRRELDRNDSPA